MAEQRRYNDLLYEVAAAGQYRRALTILDEMRRERVPPTVVTHNHVLQSFAKAGRFEDALDYFHDLEATAHEAPRWAAPNAFTYGIAVSSAAKLGAARDAQALVDGMLAAGVTPNVVVLSSLVDAYDKAGDGAGALRCVARMPRLGVAPNIVALNSALSALSRGGCADAALALFWFMRRKDYDAAVSAAAAEGLGGGDADTAAALGEVLRALEGGAAAGAVPDPDSVTYSTLLLALQRVQRCAEIQQVFGELLREAATNSDGGKGRVRPTSRSISCFLYACSHLGDGARASQLLRRVGDYDVAPDNFMFAMAIMANGRAKDWREALRLVLVDLPAAGLEADEFVLSTAITACAVPAQGAWEEGLKLYNAYLKKGREPGDVLAGAAMKAAAVGGSTAAALAIMRRWESSSGGRGATTRLYNTALAAALRSSPPDVDAARVLLAEMEGAAEAAVEEAEGAAAAPDMISYGTAIAVEARAGGAENVARVLSLLDTMRARGLRPNERIYGIALNALCAQPDGAWPQAVRVLRMALADDVEATPLLVDPVFATLAARPPTAAQLRQAVQLLKALEAAGRGASTAAMASLVDGLINISDDDDAAAVAGGAAGASGWQQQLSGRDRLQLAVKVLRFIRKREAPADGGMAVPGEPAAGFPVDVATRLVTVAERLNAWPEALRGLEEMRLAGVSFYRVGVLDEVFRRLVSAWSITVPASGDDLGLGRGEAALDGMSDEAQKAVLQQIVANLDAESTAGL